MSNNDENYISKGPIHRGNNLGQSRHNPYGNPGSKMDYGMARFIEDKNEIDYIFSKYVKSYRD